MERLISFWEFLGSRQGEIVKQIFEHLGLTIIALAIATSMGVFLGIILTRNKQIADKVLGVVSAIQTIPSLALLGFLLPILGIGKAPAIVALFLYALLPIVRNTFTGIEEVNASIKEAAQGVGMPDRQILFKVELPLAIPVIFAGIRTATVTTVGVGTISAYIGSGGLGEFIFRGIALNNADMILAGAIPAAGLAVLLDFILGLLEKKVAKYFKQILISFVVLVSIFLGLLVAPAFFNNSFKAGFTSEFMERSDGYPGLRKHYNLALEAVELGPSVMYEALKENKVDVISGFATDGIIKAYDLRILEDDRNFFPPYYAAPIVREDTLRKYPELREVLAKLAGKISKEKMAELNYLADNKKEDTLTVAKKFLNELNLKTSTSRQGKGDIVIGSKNFTEQYILADILAVLIENYTNLDADLKTGLGGTKIAFDALSLGSIDMYPEYTGTALLVIFQPDKGTVARIIEDKDEVLKYVRRESKEDYNLEWLEPFGFNNTYALMMRNQQAEELNIRSISDLKNYLE